MFKVLFSLTGRILLLLWWTVFVHAKVQEEYTIKWSDLDTDKYTRSKDVGPVFLGDGAEYIFEVTDIPPDVSGKAKFKWDITPSGGVLPDGITPGEETTSSSITWQSPMSTGRYTVKVEAWVPGPGPGPGETLKGMWDDTLEIPFLDIYFKDEYKGWENDAFLSAKKGDENVVAEDLYGFVGKPKEKDPLDDILLYWEDRGKDGEPGDWDPKSDRTGTNKAGETSTTFTVGDQAEAGNWQQIGGKIKTAPKAGEADVTSTGEKELLQVNLVELKTTGSFSVVNVPETLEETALGFELKPYDPKEGIPEPVKPAASVSNPSIKIDGPYYSKILSRFPLPPEMYFEVWPGDPNQFNSDFNRNALSGGTIEIEAGPCLEKVTLQVTNSPPKIIDKETTIPKSVARGQTKNIVVTAGDPESSVNISLTDNIKTLTDAIELLRARTGDPVPWEDFIPHVEEVAGAEVNANGSVTKWGWVSLGKGYGTFLSWHRKLLGIEEFALGLIIKVTPSDGGETLVYEEKILLK